MFFFQNVPAQGAPPECGVFVLMVGSEVNEVVGLCTSASTLIVYTGPKKKVIIII